jgi:hypothetical protein
MVFRKTLIPFLVAAVGLLGIIGCGSKHGTVPVSGTVTVNDQPPPGAGTVLFTVVEPAAGFPNRPAMAKFDESGEFSVTSYEPGDGLIPGSYKVAVECYETPPNMDGKPVKSYIDEKYMSGATSGFELTVEPGSKPIQFDVQLE